MYVKLIWLNNLFIRHDTTYSYIQWFTRLWHANPFSSLRIVKNWRLWWMDWRYSVKEWFELYSLLINNQACVKNDNGIGVRLSDSEIGWIKVQGEFVTHWLPSIRMTSPSSVFWSVKSSGWLSKITIFGLESSSLYSQISTFLRKFVYF